jgi:hypothetical protein
MANLVIFLLIDSFGLFEKVIVYVKDEASNLNTITNALQFIIFHSPLQLFVTFVGLCFGHAMSKVVHMPMMIPKSIRVLQKSV